MTEMSNAFIIILTAYAALSSSAIYYFLYRKWSLSVLSVITLISLVVFITHQVS